MSKGMDMLVQTLLKATGLEPEKVIDQFKGAQQLLVSTLENFDTRLQAIEKQLGEMNEKISAISKPALESFDGSEASTSEE